MQFKRTISQHSLLVFILTVSLVISACSKTVKWKEEVQLNSGQVIFIERETYHRPGGGEIATSSGWKPEYNIIRVDYPIDSGRTIEWRTMKWDAERKSWPELPLVLDVEPDSNVLYVITINGGTSSGCDEYIKYHYINNSWTEIPLPDEINIRPANLLIGGNSLDLPSRITLTEKKKRNADIRYTSRYREIGPEQCLCGHRGNPYKGGCVGNMSKVPIIDFSQFTEMSANASAFIAATAEVNKNITLVTSTDFRRIFGYWTGAWTKNCETMVESVRPTYKYTGDRSSGISMRLNAFEALVKAPDGSKKRVVLPDQIQFVQCSGDKWFVISGNLSGQLIATRFSNHGELEELVKLSLELSPSPGSHVSTNQPSRLIADFAMGSDTIKLSVADYIYESTAPEGGKIVRRTDYVVRRNP